MKTYPVICMGEHNTTPQVGTIAMPDDALPWQIANAQAGYLCEDCGTAAAYLVTLNTGSRLPPQANSSAARALAQVGVPNGHPPGQVPTAKQVDVVLVILNRGRKLPA